jgi:hypothetical protein
MVSGVRPTFIRTFRAHGTRIKRIKRDYTLAECSVITLEAVAARLGYTGAGMVEQLIHECAAHLEITELELRIAAKKIAERRGK